MGEALTLDSIVNSVDAELVATGPSAKGPDRGAIVRHGRYVLWGFEGPVSGMTEAGKRLFVNTVAFTARHANSTVLEKRRNGTRDSLFASLKFAKRVPGYLNTIKKLYVPGEMSDKNFEEIEQWVVKSRPYLRVEGDRRFVVDPFALSLNIPNHKKEFLETCISNLKERKSVQASLEALERYTSATSFGDSPDKWEEWFSENKDYLYFSDRDGFVFKLDEQAKEKAVSFEKFRGWSSEFVDYRYRPASEDNLNTEQEATAER